MSMCRDFMLGGCLFAVAFAGVGCARDLRPDVALAMTPLLSSTAATDRAAVRSDVRAFYEQRDGRPAWIGRREPTPAAGSALRVLERAADHGFSPDDYGWTDLSAARSALDDDDQHGADDERVSKLAAFDVRLTSSLLALGRDVAVGRTRPNVPGWEARRDAADLVGSLVSASTGTLDGWLDAVRPRHPQYAKLQAALAAVGADARDGRARSRTIALNMERWRWLPSDLGDPYVFVNIPSFDVTVVEAGEPVLSMAVVVGTRANRTPVFSGVMETVVFSPYWHIPESIAVGETAARAADDPDYLRRNQIEVLDQRTSKRVDPADVDWEKAEDLRDLKLRQRPGAGNALGHVKFLFPNKYNVYLHDTPADALFDRKTRALSHGCVRLQEPTAMARYVLRHQAEWNAERIDRAMQAGDEQHVRLDSPLPVHIAYFTAWVDERGQVVTWPDIYGYDALQAAVRPRKS